MHLGLWTLPVRPSSAPISKVPLSNSIQKNIQAAISIDNCETAFGYIAWTPSYILSGSAYELYTLPFVLSPNNTSYSLNDGSLGPRPLGDGLAPIPATFYAVTYPNMTDENWFGTEGLGCKEQASGGGATNLLQNITVIQCELHNSSYHALFSFRNGEQTIDVTMDKTPLNSVSPIFVLDMTSPYGPLANYSNGKPIAYKTAEVETLSYQAVMASFGSVLVGTLWNSQGSNGGIVANGTSVMSTVLGEAEELGWMNDHPQRMCISLVHYSKLSRARIQVKCGMDWMLWMSSKLRFRSKWHYRTSSKTSR
jgi:hypothetical protein